MRLLTVRVAAGLFLVGVLTGEVGAQTRPVTFSRDVAPVVYRRCIVCHHEGGSGPFDLTSYTAVRQRARQIVDVTASGYMPPWKPTAGVGDFVGDSRLDASEIQIFRRWIDDGAVEGDRADLPSMPPFTGGWQLGQPDLVVHVPAYTLPAEGTDVFRIFVVPLPVSSTKYVRGVEFRSGASNIVHHANIRIDRTPASRAFDDDDPQPGYDGLIARSATYPDGHFLAWTPGQVAPLSPSGLAWRLDPETDLVVELHLQPTGKAEIVQPTIGLFFGTDPPTLTPAMIRLGKQSIDIAAGNSNYVVNDSFELPVAVDVLALQPHAHYRAREIRAAARLPDGTTRSLIEIKDWDFRWQQVYRYRQPIALPKGTRILMEYRYDNSAANLRNVQRPPKRVVWGQRSADEMGDLWVQVLPHSDRDLETLATAFRPKQLAEDIVGYEARIRVEPSSVPLRDDIGLLYLEAGRFDLAANAFRVAADLRPASAPAHFNLATALTFAGQADEAIHEYRRALELRPDYALAHNNLGAVYLQRDQFEEAQRYFREAIRFEPAYAEAIDNLGRALFGLQKWGQAVEAFAEAARLRPRWPVALADLAWALATVPDEKLQDGGRAIALASLAAELTERRDPRVLDVLAAVYAHNGEFPRAIETATAALVLSDGQTATDIRAHLAEFKRGRPVRVGR